MARAGFFAALDRWGLLKYALATLFTVLAFTLTAGAFLLDELAKRPARPRALPAAWVERQSAPPAPGWRMRAPVAHAVRFAAEAKPPTGFSFYDIAASDTPQTLAAKCTRKRFRLGKVQGEACDFTAALSGQNAPEGAVAAFVRERGRACCAVTTHLPHQLVTYVFGQERTASGQAAEPIHGTVVFSEVGGGLLRLTLRFSARIDSYATAVTRYLDERCGPPTPLPGSGAVWARDGGLVTLVRAGRELVVTAYYLANIDRHAAQTRELAARQPQPQPHPGPSAPTGRLAMANP